MADTVTWSLLRELASFRAEKGCAIEPLPQPRPVRGADRGRRADADERAAEQAEKTDRNGPDPRAARARCRRTSNASRDWFDDDFERDGAQAVARLRRRTRQLLVDARAARARRRDRYTIDREFYLAPLVPRRRARRRRDRRRRRTRAGTDVTGCTTDACEEIVDHFDEQPGRHDQGGWSQARYQRHIDEARAGAPEGRSRRSSTGAGAVCRSRRSCSSCSEEMRTEFADALSPEARDAVVGWAPAEAHAGPAQLLEAVTPVLEEARGEGRGGGRSQRWREEAGRNARASAGWEQTLEAASDGRVELLLFQEGVDHDGLPLSRAAVARPRSSGELPAGRNAARGARTPGSTSPCTRRSPTAVRSGPSATSRTSRRSRASARCCGSSARKLRFRVLLSYAASRERARARPARSWRSAGVCFRAARRCFASPCGISSPARKPASLVLRSGLGGCVNRTRRA